MCQYDSTRDADTHEGGHYYSTLCAHCGKPYRDHSGQDKCPTREAGNISGWHASLTFSCPEEAETLHCGERLTGKWHAGGLVLAGDWVVCEGHLHLEPHKSARPRIYLSTP